jgi:hypothetical protein
MVRCPSGVTRIRERAVGAPSDSGAVGVDQRHGAGRHAVPGQEIGIRPRQHVHDGVADAEDVESGCRHVGKTLPSVMTAR